MSTGTAGVAVAGHAYPWDVLGDPDFPGRVRDLGLTSVTLAAAYHSTRAATPMHPGRALVDARYAALYRPARDPAWSTRRLRPGSADWLDEPDAFGTAAAALRSEGLAVTAWIVLTHSTRLGTAYPDVTVVNCFGERYPYALCPSHDEVRDYAATLVAEAVADVPLAGVSLEACGQMGVTHLGHHEKTAGAWTAAAERWLSVCCCAGCAEAWTARGIDPEPTVVQLRAAVRGGPAPDVADALLAVRHAATDALRTGVLAALREYAPGVPVTLHAQADPWATGPSPGLTGAAAAEVDALLVPAWPTTSDSVDGVAAAATSGTVTEAYVTVLPPADPDQVTGHVRRLLEAGASGLGLYHLGLAPPPRQRTIAQIVEVARG